MGEDEDTYVDMPANPRNSKGQSESYVGIDLGGLVIRLFEKSRAQPFYAISISGIPIESLCNAITRTALRL